MDVELSSGPSWDPRLVEYRTDEQIVAIQQHRSFLEGMRMAESIRPGVDIPMHFVDSSGSFGHLELVESLRGSVEILCSSIGDQQKIWELLIPPSPDSIRQMRFGSSTGPSEHLKMVCYSCR